MINDKKIEKLISAGIFFAVLTIVIGRVAPGETDEPLAIVSPTSTVIQIYNVSDKDLALTVSGGNGAYAQRDIPVGERFSIVLDDAKGKLPDGRYKYELMTIPKSVRDQLEVQTGSFEIVEGEIAYDMKRSYEMHEN